jgi:putative transposase
LASSETEPSANIPEVLHYVQGQTEHHRMRTFQEEYVAFLKKHEIDYDEKYIWD